MIIHTNDGGFQVNEDRSGDVLPSPGLTEEGCERVIVPSHGLVTRHLAVWLDTMFQAVELPAGVPHLNTSLANVDGDAFALKEKRGRLRSGNTADDIDVSLAHYLNKCSSLKGLSKHMIFMQNPKSPVPLADTRWKHKHICGGGKEGEVQSPSKTDMPQLSPDLM